MDPHRYFEHKYSSLIKSAPSSAAALQIIDELADWLAGAEFTHTQLAKLDLDLGAQGLPTIGLIRGPYRPAAISLLHDTECATGECVPATGER